MSNRSSWNLLMRLAPQTLLLLAGLALVALLAISIAFLVNQPWLGLTLAPVEHDMIGLQVVDVHTKSPSDTRVLPGERILWVAAPDHPPVYLLGSDIAPDPDQAQTYAEYNSMLARQEQLATLLDQPEVILGLADGRQIRIKPELQRPLESFHWLFLYQMVCVACGFMVAAGVWAFYVRELSARLYALSGMGLVASILPLAISSARELALHAQVMQWLSITNNLGRAIFATSIVAILWHYPKPLFRFPGSLLLAAIMLLFWVLDTGQYFETINTGARYPLLFLLCVGIWLAVLQRKQSRQDPASRTIINWFILSALIGPGMYVSLYYLPLTFNLEPVASQSVSWIGLSLFYILMLFGIVRYKLFRLERWWLAGWLWFIGGCCVIAVDYLLVSLLHLEESISLALSLMLAGFLYYPLRQWVWTALPWHGDNTELLDILPSVFRRDSRLSSEIGNADWREALVRIFKPLETRTLDKNLDRPQLEQNGLSLGVPGIEHGPSFELRFARRGGRLFNLHDVKIVDTLKILFDHMIARQKAFADGVYSERARIARDLHDDLGAVLLKMVYRATAPEMQATAQEAVSRLRMLINALESDLRSLSEVIPHWRVDVQERCADSTLQLRWRHYDNHTDFLLDSRQQINLRRLLQEATSNVIRHANAKEIDVQISMDGNRLQVSFTDDGVGLRIGAEESSGMRGMRKRVKELGGEIEWQRLTPSGCRVVWTIPVPI